MPISHRRVVALAAAALLSAPLAGPPPAAAAGPLTGKIAWGQADEAGGWDTEIWVANADGSNAQQLTHNNVDEGSATWSPDQTRIAFHRYDPNTGVQDVFVMDADGSNEHLVASVPPYQLWLSDWHGTTLLAHRYDAWGEAGDDYELVSIDVATGAVTLLTDDTDTSQGWPVFSPDGTQIAYSHSVSTPPVCNEFGCTTGGATDIYVMDVGTGVVTPLMNTNASDESFPAWSATGIAYASRRDDSDGNGNNDIYMMTTGGTEVRLTTDPGEDDRPMWSPSDEVGFLRDGPMWVMNADGSEQRSLELGTEYIDAPDWTGGVVEPQQPQEQMIATTTEEAPTVTTDVEGDGATAGDPVETTISACCGPVSISETWAVTQTPADEGYSFFGQQIDISAPAGTAEAPIALTFLVDSSTLPPETDPWNGIQIFRNGVVIERCTDDPEDLLPLATPDPCVYDSGMVDDDVLVSVYTSAASAWNFGVASSGGGGGGNPPQISVESPAEYGDEEPYGEVSSTEGGVYLLNSAETLSFTCWDDDGDLNACEASYEDGTPAFDGEPLDTSRIGERQVSFYAADDSGQTQSVSVTYRVIYAFNGFRQPVDNPGADGAVVLNKVKSGSSVPIKFSLGGNQGTAIFETGSPSVARISCTPGAPVDQIEQTVTTPAGSLSYDAKSGVYTYTLKTSKTWAGTCQELTVRLVDGTVHRAQFKGS